MLPEQLSIALKEWAVVQRSLLEAHQIVMVRKGGIIEESGDFDLRARHFLLQPTYIHETERLGDVQPCFGDWLNEEEKRKPAVGMLRFDAACEVVDTIRADRPDSLVRMSAQHIWSEQFLRGRFEWEPYKPVSVLLVRADALARPVVTPMRSEYAGCKSWIELALPVDTAGAVPAIRRSTDFARRVDLTRRLLTDDGLA